MNWKVVWTFAVLLVVVVTLPGASAPVCSPPQVACGCTCCNVAPAISARTAYATAQPLAANFASDAQLQMIMGSSVDMSGLLSGDFASWGFTWYSPSKQATFLVSVGAGTPTTSQQSAAPPGPGIVQPAPSDWADSPAVLQATAGHRSPNATVASLVVFNTTSFPTAPNQAVWGLSFNAGANQLVSATGNYIGPQ